MPRDCPDGHGRAGPAPAGVTETKQEMSLFSTVRAVSACTAVAAVLLGVSGCGEPGRPVQITSVGNNDTVWGKVVIKAEPVGGGIPDGGLDFYLDNRKLGSVAEPLACTRTFVFEWDASTVPATSVHSLGAVTKGGTAPRPPRAIRITVDSMPVLALNVNWISYWRVLRLILQSGWSTVLVESMGFPGSGRAARREPILVSPNATVRLYEGEFPSSVPLKMTITYRSLVGSHSRSEVAAIAAETETIALDVGSHRLVPDTRLPVARWRPPR
jgi:hypothetical protein